MHREGVLRRSKRLNPPSHSILRWLTDAGPHIPDDIRGVLFSELLSTRGAVIVGVLNGLLLNIVALFLHPGIIFPTFLVLDSFCGAYRIWIIDSVNRARQLERPAPMNAYLWIVILWCAVQGASSFAAMISGDHSLQLLSATTIMGIIGPICARNYPAPRLALLLVCLCDLPFVAGSCLSGDPWMLVLVAQTPLFIYGSTRIVNHFQALSIAMLKAEQDSQHHAMHDALTGLLNRRGFEQALDELTATANRELAMFCLDLDGFKTVNDRMGHHAGDALLKAVAGRLKSVAGPFDLVARLGGDEFVILAPRISSDAANWFASRLIERVSVAPYMLDGTQMTTIGVSIGSSQTPRDGTDLRDIHRHADLALYAAKAAGKGIHRRFEPPMSSTRSLDEGLPAVA